MLALLRKLLLSFLCLLFTGGLLEAAPAATSSPYDVTDAVHELDQIIDVKARHQISLGPVGMLVRGRWRLGEADSRLTQYFYVKGIYHTDLMWTVITEAFEARVLGIKFDLGESLRRCLSTSPFETNRPKILVERANEFVDSKLSHDIQRDDLSVIHVFSSPKDGKPACTFIHGIGWQAVDERIIELLKSPAAISIPYNTPVPAFKGEENSSSEKR